MTAPLVGCIEAGGTKFVLGLVRQPDEIVETITIPTRRPAETLPEAFDWLERGAGPYGGLDAIGIGSFGPLELDRASPRWGFITGTTKPGWTDTDFGARAAGRFGLPVGFDTDVNAAALAEALWGAGRGVETPTVYVTVGTGIGGGLVVRRTIMRGLSHPEMGHIRVDRHPLDREFRGSCPFHGDCLEGLASGTAIRARWGAPLSDLPAESPAAGIIAFYLAQLVVDLQAMIEPGRIIFGGGVMATPGLMARVKAEASGLGRGYFRGRPSEILSGPGLGSRAGLLGAFALGTEALKSG